jgi:hypothetical protein
LIRVMNTNGRTLSVLEKFDLASAVILI